MDRKRFQDSPSGRLISVGQGQAAYHAFVPNPLSPHLSPDWELASILSSADRALSELAGLGRTMSNPHLLIDPFIRREAVLSSRIEGTQTDLTNLYAYEVGQLPLPGVKDAPSEYDAHEVLNYVHALEYGLERLSTLPVCLRLLREIHERLLTGVRGEYATPGEFRRTQNWIGLPDCTLNEASFVPPPAPQMAEALNAFESYLHSEDVYPPLVRLALIHYQFEAIHPFLDGNGRVGRLLLVLLLVEWQILPLPLLYISAYFHRYRDTYYDLLLSVSERGTWREWSIFFLRGLTVQANDAVQRAKRLQDLQIAWHARLTHARTSALTLQLVDGLFTKPVITIPEAQRLLGVTYKSAQSTVERLLAEGMLQPVGDGVTYGKTFWASEILDIVTENNDEA